MRRFPWGRAALILVLLAILFVRIGDPFGDRGMTNVVSGLLGIVALLGALVAFAFTRSIGLRLRLAVLLALAGSAGVASALVRVEGVSGEMIPRFAWRASGRTAPESASIAAAPALAPPSDSDFPAFLGPRRDNAVTGAHLARDWNARPPHLRWRRPIGAGWSAFAIAGGWAFTLEQDASGQRVSARTLASGELVWSTVL